MKDPKKYSILIIDDDVTSISFLKDIINSDYNVSVVKSGEAGVELAHKMSPDLILLDICMEGMDGYETLNMLKASDLTKYIPVIFITAYKDEKDINQILNSEATDYINKPFTNNLVLSKIKRVI